jgi:hypothetical protein
VASFRFSLREYAPDQSEKAGFELLFAVVAITLPSYRQGVAMCANLAVGAVTPMDWAWPAVDVTAFRAPQFTTQFVKEFVQTVGFEKRFG